MVREHYCTWEYYSILTIWNFLIKQPEKKSLEQECLSFNLALSPYSYTSMMKSQNVGFAHQESLPSRLYYIMHINVPYIVMTSGGRYIDNYRLSYREEAKSIISVCDIIIDNAINRTEGEKWLKKALKIILQRC